MSHCPALCIEFLSSNAQDFIEESYHLMIRIKSEIPEQ